MKRYIVPLPPPTQCEKMWKGGVNTWHREYIIVNYTKRKGTLLNQDEYGTSKGSLLGTLWSTSKLPPTDLMIKCLLPAQCGWGDQLARWRAVRPFKSLVFKAVFSRQGEKLLTMNLRSTETVSGDPTWQQVWSGRTESCNRAQLTASPNDPRNTAMPPYPWCFPCCNTISTTAGLLVCRTSVSVFGQVISIVPSANKSDSLRRSERWEISLSKQAVLPRCRPFSSFPPLLSCFLSVLLAMRAWWTPSHSDEEVVSSRQKIRWCGSSPLRKHKGRWEHRGIMLSVTMTEAALTTCILS